MTLREEEIEQFRTVLEQLREALAWEHYYRTGHTSTLDFGQTGSTTPDDCCVCQAIEASEKAAP